MTEFRDSQYELAYPDGIGGHWWHLARNRMIWRLLRGTQGFTAPVLDVGCGRGVTVAWLRAHGVDCSGVELADVRPLPGVEPHVRGGTSATELPAEERRRVRTLLLLDVIEHVPDAAGLLGSTARAFEGLTQVILTVPARPELWSNYDEFYGHHRRYTTQMVRSLAEELGWRPAVVGYAFRPAYLAARTLASLGRDRSVAIAAPAGRTQLALHQLLAGAMVLEQRVLPRWLPGTSLIARFELSPRR